jgi:hypothetical protein
VQKESRFYESYPKLPIPEEISYFLHVEGKKYIPLSSVTSGNRHFPSRRKKQEERTNNASEVGFPTAQSRFVVGTRS